MGIIIEQHIVSNRTNGVFHRLVSAFEEKTRTAGVGRKEEQCSQSKTNKLSSHCQIHELKQMLQYYQLK